MGNVSGKSSSLLGSLASLTSVGSAGTAEEVTYDAVTPDSGVHENFNALSPDEQEKLREEWKAELAKTEEEIQTLRQVLGAKVKTAQDLKRRLGITVWREFTEDLNNSMKTVRESQPVQKANEVITEIQEAVSNAPLYRRMSGAFSELGETISQQPVYQKTAGAMSAVGEKTSSLFGGIGAKFGQLKETPTFKSFEERVGGVYSAARTRMGGSGSNSTQDFEEALKEAEGEKAALEAANGGTLQTSTTPGTDVTQPAAS
ncbi:tumor protein D54-like isoform X5 [Scylla paramamosain]|uniref:tumor protein D54-like isoform X5 n=1 Tax=Scylla paramamosain TaxID=85552 RepID=UPI003083104E